MTTAPDSDAVQRSGRSSLRGIGKQTPRQSPPQTLSFDSRYVCPVCRHGQIESLTLMDAFACNFCRHIFTANLKEQLVQVVDSSQPMSWRWNGRNWQSVYQSDANLTVLIWLVSGTMIVLPGMLVWLAMYTFPPLPGSPWSWFPAVWVGCTFVIHGCMVLWLLAEHYQFPLYVSARVLLQSWFRQR